MIAKAALAAFGLVAAASAQTYTDCSPLKKTCSPDAAIGQVGIDCDFTKGACDSFHSLPGTDVSLSYPGDGALLSIANGTQAPTIVSNNYFFFGRVEIVCKAAPGRGVVTSVVLQSDDLDEVDWEWIGSDNTQVQTNYFGKGDTTTYDRGGFSGVDAPTDKFHTYVLEWTAESIVWSIDNVAVRTLNYADAQAGARYPQTPMQLKLGTWVAGLPTNAAGTVEWAGGLTDFSQAPFNATYQSVKVIDYAGGSSAATESIREYKYGDHSGSWQSIKVIKGEPIVPTTSATAADATSTPAVGTPGSAFGTGASSSTATAAATPGSLSGHNNGTASGHGSGSGSGSGSNGHGITGVAGGYTTSTIYSTSVHTVTSCAATVKNCPARSTVVVTDTIAISTTVCPIAEATKGAKVAVHESTSTVYATKIHTVLQCPPSVTNCPARAKTTGVVTTQVPVGTKVYTVTETLGGSESEQTYVANPGCGPGGPNCPVPGVKIPWPPVAQGTKPTGSGSGSGTYSPPAGNSAPVVAPVPAPASNATTAFQTPAAGGSGSGSGSASTSAPVSGASGQFVSGSLAVVVAAMAMLL